MQQAIPLRQAIGDMANIPQFFVWKLIDDPKNPLKKKKIPWRDNHEHGHNDPAYWLSFDGASALLASMQNTGDFTLGFSLTGNTGYWFIDVDGCGAGDMMSPLGLEILSIFPGVAFEYSSSGLGYHLFGRGTAPEHRKKDAEKRGIEFYTDGRGIAFGRTGVAYGNADCADWSHVLHTVWVPKYMPPAIGDNAAWDGKPHPQWNGPRNDAELLRRAMQSSGMRAAFGGRATFADLWTNNLEALRATYPDATADDGIDRSSADAALAQHLAFWTGNDAQRIESLMWQSDLVRDKWSNHRTYLKELTITQACFKQGDAVLRDKPIVVESPPKIDNTVVIASSVDNIAATLLNPDDQKTYFEGCVYVTDEHRVFTPKQGGVMLTPDKFNVIYGGRSFIMDTSNNRVATKAFDAFTQSQAVEFPRVRSTTFRPDLPPASVVTERGVDFLNSYIDEPIKMKQGDASIFFDHIARVYPIERDQEIIISYLAAMIQHKGAKFMWCPVLQGGEGCGKGLIFEAMKTIIGPRYAYTPSAAKLSAQFNDWIDQKLLITIDEVRIRRGDTETWDTIKPMITDRMIEAEGKGRDKKLVRNYANFLMSTNHKDAMVEAAQSRRVSIFYSVFQDDDDVEQKLLDAGMDATYFRRLVDFIRSDDGAASIAYALGTYKILDELNPAVGCLRAPHTSSYAESLEVSRDPIEVLINEAIEEKRKGFRGGWISSFWLGKFFEENRRGHIGGQTKKRILARMGYFPHPSFDRGRANSPIPADLGTRSILFVKKGHLSENFTNGADIVQKYVSDNFTNNPTPPQIPGTVTQIGK